MKPCLAATASAGSRESRISTAQLLEYLFSFPLLMATENTSNTVKMTRTRVEGDIGPVGDDEGMRARKVAGRPWVEVHVTVT